MRRHAKPFQEVDAVEPGGVLRWWRLRQGSLTRRKCFARWRSAARVTPGQIRSKTRAAVRAETASFLRLELWPSDKAEWRTTAWPTRKACRGRPAAGACR